MQRYGTYDNGTTLVRGEALGKVLGLLGMAALFTAAGAVLGAPLGRGGFWLGAIGSLACVFILPFVKERFPLNLVLLFGFATLEGMLLGQILEVYIAAGQGALVINAASATGIVALVAGGVGYTTKRDLSGLGGFLFIGLIGLLVASLVGLFVHLALLQIVISAAGVLLFSGFLVFDLNRVANAGQVSQGDTILLAVSVYLDIINLFLFMLRLLGIVRGGD